MVDLPQVPRRLVTTEAPKSSVTAEDIAGPYKQFGKALDQLGEGLEDVSVVAGEKAAQTAVTRDQNGDLQVEQMPVMSGKAGVAFNRIAKQSYAFQVGDEASKIITAKRAEFDGRPQEFQSWSDKYLGELVSKQPDEAMQNMVRQSVGRTLSETYNGLVAQRAKLDLQTANNALDSQIMTTADDLEVLARRGGANSPDFLARMKDFDHLLDDKVKNPLLAFPKEKADRLRDDVLTRVYGAAILDGTEKVYQSQGFEAARQHLRNSVSELGATVKQSDKIERQGLSWLRSEEAGFRGERDAIGREWSAAKGQIDTLPRDQLLDLQERARAVGAVRVEQDIAVRLGALDINTQLRGLPASERTNIAVTGKINLPLVDRIVGAESGGNANAAASSSSALGAGQFVRGTWLSMVAKYRPDLAQGKTQDQILELRRDPTLSREMVQHYADDNGQAMKAAGVPVNDATLYLAHFLGPGDAIKVLQADPHAAVSGVVAQQSIDANGSVFARNPTAGSLVAWAGRKVGVGEADLTKSREGLVALGMLNKQIGQNIDERITGLSAAVSRQEFPDAEEANALLVQVHALGTPDQQRKVAELVATAQYGADFRKMSKDKRESIIAGLQEKARDGASQFERDLGGALAKADGEITQAYKNDPYGAAYRYGDSLTKALAPINWADPAGAAATLKAKVGQQSQIRADQNLEAFSALRDGEAQSLRTTLTQGDPQAGAAAIGLLKQTLPPDIYQATIADKPIRDALDGMVRSYDPVRLNTAMTTLDQLYRQDPQGFAKNFGEDSVRRLQTWQARKDSMTPQQMAEYFQRADDPAQKAARKALAEDADEKLKKLTPADVATSLGGSWSITPGFVARNVTGSDPQPPADAVQAQTLLSEYTTLVRERYIDTGNMDAAKAQAADRLKLTWGPSVANGNALMKYPPERYYPAVNDGHGWMAEDLNKSIEQMYGPRVTMKNPAQYASPTINWSSKLVSDTQTEADVKSGRPPSYVVAITKPDGRVEIPQGEDGRPMRYRFDPAPAQAAAREEFGGDRQRLLGQMDAVRDRMRRDGKAAMAAQTPQGALPQ